MNRRIARQGFALITAVVISAAILATIVGIATLTVRETRVQAEQSASDQALAIAEGGLTEVVSRLRTDQTLATTVNSLGNDAVWEPDPSIVMGSTDDNPSSHAFYWVKVKVLQQGAVDVEGKYETYAAGFIVRPDISSSTPDQLRVLALTVPPTDVLARRVVQMTLHGKMKIVTTTTTNIIPGVTTTTRTTDTIIKPGEGNGSSPFDYGVFTGDTFSMVGSKDLANVTTDGTSGMYAKQDIKMTSNHTLTNLELYAEGAIDAKGVTVVGHDENGVPLTLAPISHYPYTPPKPLNFPALDVEKYMDLFDAFVAGTAPFGGPVELDGVVTNPGYPDLSDPLVRSAVLSALGNPQNNNVTVTVGGKSHHFVTPDKLSSYTDQVVKDTLPGLSSDPALSSVQRTALKDTLSKSVFYVRNSVGDPDAKWTGAQEFLAGVIVCSGEVDFTGCPDYAEGQVAAILAKGDIDIAGSTSGSTAARGIFYTEGKVDYTGSGWFEGQMISQDTVRFTGSGDVTFKNYSSMIGDLLPGGSATTTTTTTTTTTDPTTTTTTTTEIEGFESFSQTASGWTEKAWADFLNPS